MPVCYASPRTWSSLTFGAQLNLDWSGTRVCVAGAKGAKGAKGANFSVIPPATVSCVA